ncbi:hypothetical protein D9611_001686 [Ephemerocybe angulata]|uniref:F-box domain-containing protein n=1 Tax=Ephemerocybe angulata TaxID=980116 RepID=A0A8H5CHP2_9AGAR|nr:hypothetical protein D9611_001686 [Tulosesus angulatus]
MAHSQLLGRIGTNYVPDAEEVAVLKSLVRIREDTIQSMDTRIQELKDELASLNVQRARHIQAVEDYRALISPIKQIPDDILTNILLSLLPNLQTKNGPKMSSKHPAVVASHVSRGWRSLALGTPLLWSFIDVEIPINSYPFKWLEHVSRVQGYKDAVEAWISRSAECPLAIRMVDRGFSLIEGSPSAVIKARKEVVDAILACSGRWKCVCFNFRSVSEATVDLFRLLEATPLPLLESVDAELFLSVVPRNVQPPMSVIARRQTALTSGLFTAPTLRSLRLYGSWGHISPTQCPNTLTELTLDIAPTSFDQPNYPSHILHILRSSPNLIRCSFPVYDYDPRPVTEAGWEVVQMAHLEALELHGFPPPLGFASHLALPSLHTLIIRLREGPEDLGLDVADERVCELFRSLGGSLTSLVLYYERLAQTTILHCLGSLQNLTHLRLVSIPAPYNHQSPERRDILVMDRLSRRADTGDSEWYCPKLEGLDIVIPVMDDTWEVALVELVAARCQTAQPVGVARLSDVRVTLKEAWTGADIMIVQELQERGVDTDNFNLEISESYDRLVSS